MSGTRADAGQGGRDPQEVLAELAFLLDRMLALAQQAAADNCPNRPSLQRELSALRTRFDLVADELDLCHEAPLLPLDGGLTSNRF